MKTALNFFLLICLQGAAAGADDPELARKIRQHQQGATTLSDQQDELAADVQQLTIEQTEPKVIQLLTQVEGAMDDASGRLFEYDTGGPTIAAQTEVIEKIYEAAKERQKSSSSSSSGSSGGAMMDMLGRMLGKEPQPGQGKGEGEGQQPGNQGGEGMTGDSSTGNERVEGAADGGRETRRVPKKAGSAGKSIPPEFQEALRGYNRGVEKLLRP